MSSATVTQPWRSQYSAVSVGTSVSVPLPYRILFGELRNIDGGSNYTTVQATAVQYSDGRIDDGGVHEPPHVYLGDDGLTST